MSTIEFNTPAAPAIWTRARLVSENRGWLTLELSDGTTVKVRKGNTRPAEISDAIDNAADNTPQAEEEKSLTPAEFDALTPEQQDDYLDNGGAIDETEEEAEAAIAAMAQRAKEPLPPAPSLLDGWIPALGLAMARAAGVLAAVETVAEKTKKTMADQLKAARTRYEKTTVDKEVRISCGDTIAKILQGLELFEILDRADDVCGEPEGYHAAKYSHLNAGQQRMNSGNRIRNVWKKADDLGRATIENTLLHGVAYQE